MGTCIGNRNIYSNPMQKSCSSFEHKFRLFYRDWKSLVDAITSYCPDDGTVPQSSMERIMTETGLRSAYDDKNSHLKELLDEVVNKSTNQKKTFIYLVLFMCGGNELSKLDYLCATINNMNISKDIVSGSEFKKVLECLMEVSVIIIPKLGKIDLYKEEIAKIPIEAAVNRWCFDSNKETLTINEVRSWGLKCHNFTPGEARAAMVKLIPNEPYVLMPESKIEAPIKNIPKDELRTTEVPA